jgi:predicted nucleic acid-binding protein
VSVFVDTSALYAVLDRDDAHHAPAAAIWTKLLADEVRLVTSSYVVVESCALIQSRLGMKALRTFLDDVLPVIETYWIAEHDHRSAMDAVIVADRRGLSLVDCASFVVMRRLALRTAFAFDPDFDQQGFASPEIGPR